MLLQFSETVNNAQLDTIESTVGAAPDLMIYTGGAPANCAAAATGTLLVQINLPSDWMAGASGASKAKNGTWSGTAVGTGTAGYFRISNGSPAGDDCQIQGNIDVTGSSPTPAMGLDNTSINSGQTVTVSTFTLTAGNQ